MAFRTNKTPVLQEKTASGSVASFNTALAMPLPSCNIAVNAWQEGSGVPSPVNVRNIVPRREVNIYQRGINLWNEQVRLGYYATYNGNYVGVEGELCSNNLIPVKPNTTYYFNRSTVIGGSSGVIYYDINGRYLSGQSLAANKAFTTPDHCYFIHINLGNTYGTTYNHDVSINYPSTDTSYHAYDANSNEKVVNLDEDTYGAVYNSVTGNKLNDRIMLLLKNISWTYVSSLGVFRSNGTYPKSRIDALCECYNPVSSGPSTINNNEINFVSQYWDNNKRIIIKDTRFTDVNAFIEAMGDYKVVFEVETPTETQLTPTQIETLIGNNTIFADTGDIDLTYKDLDIAKRGSFREVFKLP